jgi:uncharacterized protein YdhG (YjbR/CyaY superfamily)
MENNSKELKTFEEYKRDYPPEIQKRLNQIEQAIKSAVPEAEEQISYNMPSFRFHGKLIYYGAFKNHIGFYPASKNIFETFRDELKIYRQSGKGTVQFAHDKPLPIDLIKKIAVYRAKENMRKAKP